MRLTPSHRKSPMDNDQRIAEGKRFAETIWWKLAKRIVEIAAEHYKWDAEAYDRAIELFLRSSDFGVEATYCEE